jgi:cytochrome c553
LLALPLLAASAHAAELTSDFDRGKIRSKAEQCQECHGEAGLGTAEHFPKLAGQGAAYLRKQLTDFRSGARKNAIMTDMAAAISARDVDDIAAYFSGSPHWAGEEQNFSAAGQKLFREGDAARGLIACVICHGEKGGGDFEAVPVSPAIAGQRESYLATQLYAWKAGDRKNSPGDVMNDEAQKLTDKEIDALAKYLSGPQAMR